MQSLASTPRARAAGLALLAICGLIAALAPSAGADEKPNPARMDLKIEAAPHDLAAGASGALRVKGTVPLGVHLYATADEGYEPLVWTPIDADGVTYHLDRVEMTKPHDYTDSFGDVYKVFQGDVEWTIPVTLSADLEPGTKVGISVAYSGCDEGQCYQRLEGHEAALWFVVQDGASTWAVADPAPPPAVPAKPALTPPVTGRLGVDEVKIELADDGSAVVVTVDPEFGHHIYGPAETTGIPVSVEPVEADGVEWGAFELPDVAESHDPIVVRVPFTRTTATTISVKVGWQACADTGSCYSPESETLSVSWDGPAPVAPDRPEAIPEGDVLFPVIEGDHLEIQTDDLIIEFYDEYGLLVLALIFGLGALLAFTPCVLPIIPITVSVITGGRADIPKRRLLGLLTVYVSSLALTFGTVGIITALAGASMSVAFQQPLVVIGISVLFGVLAFGMLGIFELQPPQWMLKLQGGAQQKGGSYLGAVFLGALMALVASPCTGPFIVGMALVSAKTQSVPLGFAMFTSLGLGMGAVLFAFGALNFALRPGPWMVWVRYSFGMLLLGGALYQVAFQGIMPPMWVWISGLGFALLSGALVIWHLREKEGESSVRVLATRGGGVAVMLAVATVVVALLTARGETIEFEKLRDVDHLVQRIEESRANGQPVVVDVWATFCTYCKKYEELIAETPELRKHFEKLTRLKIDTTHDEQAALCDALGVPRGSQPYMVFLDRKGRIRRAADVKEWYKDKSTDALLERAQLVLNDVQPPAPDAEAAESASTK